MVYILSRPSWSGFSGSSVARRAALCLSTVFFWWPPSNQPGPGSRCCIDSAVVRPGASPSGRNSCLSLGVGFGIPALAAFSCGFGCWRTQPADDRLSRIIFYMPEHHLPVCIIGIGASIFQSGIQLEKRTRCIALCLPSLSICKPSWTVDG